MWETGINNLSSITTIVMAIILCYTLIEGVALLYIQHVQQRLQHNSKQFTLNLLLVSNTNVAVRAYPIQTLNTF